jgi:hypothetical protein
MFSYSNSKIMNKSTENSKIYFLTAIFHYMIFFYENSKKENSICTGCGAVKHARLKILSSMVRGFESHLVH